MLVALLIALVFQVASMCFAKQPVLVCRTERRELLPYPKFRDDVCARCYKYMPASAFKFKLRYDGRLGMLLDTRTNITHLADPFGGTSSPILDSFIDETMAKKWKDCCSAAWECCHRMSRDPPTEAGVTYCPRTWDGWHCWPDTPAGMAAKQPCQNYIYFKGMPPSCNRYAYKQCMDNGTWYLNEDFREWTNYSTCGRSDEHRRHFRFQVVTYFISMIALIPALVIFSMYKQLRVQRIAMHRNLFMSLLLNSFAMVLFKLVVISTELGRRSSKHVSVLDENGPGCKLLFLLTKYFRMTNYMWMFCEGYYLHKLIAAAFAEQKNLLMFYAIGWGLPVLPVSIYGILRATLENEKCWAFPVESYEWVMNVLNLLSLVINLFFLCNIIRVLVTKLRATHANEPSQYRKAVRATLVLVPLFGLHFCMVIYRPHSSTCGFLEAYAYLNFAMDGLQGLMVAVTFCYMNGEVLYLLKRSYQRYKLHLQIRGSRHSNAFLRRLSTTQDSNLNESQNHPHHRAKHIESKLREVNQCYHINGNEGKGQFKV